MTKRRRNTNIDKRLNGSFRRLFYPLSLVAGVVCLWELLLVTGTVDAFVLPSPLTVVKAFTKDFRLLAYHSVYTLTEGFIGLFISIALGYLAAIGMDRFAYMRKALYPLLVLSQTIPYVAVAPLLVLWFGYNMPPKIILVTLTCFFPLATGVYDGMRNIQAEYLDELSVMGGKYIDGLLSVKIPLGLPGFFSGLKIAATYSIVGAVVAEWIGGVAGLGVYMTRVRKSYEFDKMFAVIFLIAVISLMLIGIVKYIERRVLENVT